MPTPVATTRAPRGYHKIGADICRFCYEEDRSASATTSVRTLPCSIPRIAVATIRSNCTIHGNSITVDNDYSTTISASPCIAAGVSLVPTAATTSSKENPG